MPFLPPNQQRQSAEGITDRQAAIFHQQVATVRVRQKIPACFEVLEQF